MRKNETELVQVRLDRHFCAVHAVADMLRSVCLTYLCLCYTHPTLDYHIAVRLTPSAATPVEYR